MKRRNLVFKSSWHENESSTELSMQTLINKNYTLWIKIYIYIYPIILISKYSIRETDLRNFEIVIKSYELIYNVTNYSCSSKFDKKKTHMHKVCDARKLRQTIHIVTPI